MRAPSVPLADKGNASKLRIPFADASGPGSVVAAKMAAEEFGGKVIWRHRRRLARAPYVRRHRLQPRAMP